MRRVQSQNPGVEAIAVTVMIAMGSLLNACASSAQNQVQVPIPATPTSSMQPMDHSSMGKMDHGMDLGPADANYDLRFIDAMIPHHEGAVVMAQDALKKSKRPEILKLATSIVKAQDKEISEMQQWRRTWYPQATSTPMAWHADMNHMMAMSPQQRQAMMMSLNLGPADANYDLRFINAMIPHHEGAVVMARDALKKSKRSDIRNLAEAILSSQQTEIQQMQQWRRAWYQ